MYYTSINKIVTHRISFRNTTGYYLRRTADHAGAFSYKYIILLRVFETSDKLCIEKKTMPCYMEQLAYRLCNLPYNLRCIGRRLRLLTIASGFLQDHTILLQEFSRMHNFSVVLVAIQLHK